MNQFVRMCLLLKMLLLHESLQEGPTFIRSIRKAGSGELVSPSKRDCGIMSTFWRAHKLGRPSMERKESLLASLWRAHGLVSPSLEGSRIEA